MTKPTLLSLAILSLAARTALAEPPPYSLPWQLRPITGANVVRFDSTVAGYDGGTTAVSTLLASYKLSSSLTPLVRIAATRDAPPMGASAYSVSNPLLGALWTRPLAPAFKLAGFAALAIPVGSGGGPAAIAARSSMDNAMFAVDDLTMIGGVGIAWVDRGLTVQLEATVLQLLRVRGAQPDATRTNFTSGVHAGYMALPWLSFGAELRYQRWLSADVTGPLRDSATVAAGVRFHGERLRPGISYARGLDDPMSGRSYHIVQLDLPFVF